MQFDYTINEERKIFATNLYDIGIRRLMDIMPQVNWGDYSFKGQCSLLSDSDDNGPLWSEHAVIAKCNYGEDYRPYVYIGGCVYALHSLSQPDIPHYIDPTGDIDVFVDLPRITTIDQSVDLVTLSQYYKSVLNEDHTPNTLIRHFTNWLSKELHRIFNSNFMDILDNLVEYESNPDELNINKKLYFVVLQDPTVIKVQVHCKVVNMKEPDTLLECVIVADKKEQRTETLDTGSKAFNKYCDVYENMYIQSYDSLTDDNMKSIIAREILAADPQYQHKLYNHIGRLQYLNYIYPSYKTKLTQSVTDFLYFLWEKRDKLPLYNYKKELDDKAFMSSLVGNFLKNMHMEKDTDMRPFTVQLTGTNTYKSMTKKDLILLYDTLLPERGRSLFKQKTQRSVPMIRRTLKVRPSVSRK